MSKSLTRRTVQTIKETFQPRRIFELVSGNGCDYSLAYRQSFWVRDRAGMSLAFLTGGRVTEIFGGTKFKLRKVSDTVIGRTRTGRALYKKRASSIGKHVGLRRENLELTEDFLFIRNMIIVKRSQKIIDKYGLQIATRDTLAFPLRTGLFTNVFYDQLVPFTWLVVEYLEKFAPEKGKLFPYQDGRAWQIINEVTGLFPNWFRAQADRFYGHYITKDSVKHSKFIGRVKAESSMPYIRYDWGEDLKETTMAMNFDWIEPAVHQIKERIHSVSDKA
jgi:hypothetical protein